MPSARLSFVCSALNSNLTYMKTMNNFEISCAEYFINNVYNTIALSTDKIVSGVFVNIQYIAYMGIKVDEDFSSFVIFGYGIRAIHISKTSANWSSIVMGNTYV